MCIIIIIMKILINQAKIFFWNKYVNVDNQLKILKVRLIESREEGNEIIIQIVR